MTLVKSEIINFESGNCGRKSQLIVQLKHKLTAVNTDTVAVTRQKPARSPVCKLFISVDNKHAFMNSKAPVSDRAYSHFPALPSLPLVHLQLRTETIHYMITLLQAVINKNINLSRRHVRR